MAAVRKSSVVLWTGVAAAAAGIAAVVVLFKWKERSLIESDVNSRLRDVQDVLADCYNKISEIEGHLPELLTSEIRQNAIRLTKPLSHN